MAPVGTALPTNIATALNAAFKPVGHISEDAVTESYSVTTEKIKSWQSKAGVRTVITEFEWTFQFVALETSPLIFDLYYGDVTGTTATGITTTVIPNDPVPLQKACVVEITDGTVIRRYAFSKVEVSDRGEVNHSGGEGTGYDLTISVLGGVSSLGSIITNDPAFAALSS